MSNIVKLGDLPSISVLGLGGCGINLTRQLKKHIDKQIFTNYIDSSEANRPDDPTDNSVYIIANKNGGGKIRSTNLDEIKARIPQLDETIIGDSDIYILVGSLAGATGGVMLPLMTKELVNRGKKVIVAMLSESMDQKGTANTTAALKTMVTLAAKENIYLPTILAHTDRSRAGSDNYVIDQIQNIIKILTAPCYEIDKNDRLNWLDARKTMNRPAGLHMVYGISEGFSIEAIPDLHDKQLIADSVLNLGITTEGTRLFVQLPTVHSRFSKDGILADNNDLPVSGIITETSHTLDAVLDELDKKHQLYKAPIKLSLNNVIERLSSTDEDIEDYL